VTVQVDMKLPSANWLATRCASAQPARSCRPQAMPSITEIAAAPTTAGSRLFSSANSPARPVNAGTSAGSYRGTGPTRETTGCRRPQRRVGPQDLLMHRLQLRSGVSAELLGEPPPGLLKSLECLGLPPGPVQRQHQLPDQPFIGRPGHRFLCQAADQRVMLALPQPDVT
jgi:hypothetical protein